MLVEEPEISNYRPGKWVVNTVVRIPTHMYDHTSPDLETENKFHMVEVNYVKIFGSKEEAEAWNATNNADLEKYRNKPPKAKASKPKTTKGAPTKAAQPRQNLRKDDLVQIVGGTHKGVVGTFVRMTEKRAKVKIDGAEKAIKVEFVQALTTPPRGDGANIIQGDRVRVVGGQHKGKAATYVRETDKRVFVQVDGTGGRYLKKEFVAKE